MLTLLTMSMLISCKKEVIKPEQQGTKVKVDTVTPDRIVRDTGEIMAEFALIEDPDGYTFVRQNAGKNFKVIDTLRNGAIVFCMEPQGDWTGIDYEPTDDDFKTASVHNSRLKLISTYKPIPKTETGRRKVTLSAEGIRIEATEKTFDRSAHKLQFNREEGYLETIDGKHIWGTDGNVPAREYASVCISLNGKEISLPAEALENVFEPNLDYTAANYDEANDILYISSFNSDGAGGYQMLWVIEKGIYSERVIMHGF